MIRRGRVFSTAREGWQDTTGRASLAQRNAPYVVLVPAFFQSDMFNALCDSDGAHKTLNANSMTLTLRAWQDGRYIALAELLDLIGPFYPGRQWHMRIEECAPQPGSEILEAWSAETPVSLEELLGLVAPDIQVIDGVILATGSAGETALRLIAVDGSDWDIESDCAAAIAAVRNRFPDVRDVSCLQAAP